MPRKECPPTTLSANDKEKLKQPGFTEIVDTKGCCPQSSVVCKPGTCPEKPKCPEYYNITEQIIPGLCCPIYKCRKYFTELNK